MSDLFNCTMLIPSMSRKRDRAFLADAGDQIKFEPIDRATYDALDARAEKGEVVARSENLP